MQEPSVLFVIGQSDSGTGFDWKPLLRILTEYRSYLIYGVIILAGLLILRSLVNRVSNAIRRRRPATIHPNLQKYSVDHVEVDRKRREMAVQVVATSTGSRLAGFRIVRQVEAVFVDGFRTPDEALTALKALAVERGANALLNVHTDRTPAGKCSAFGDAIVAAPIAPGPPEPLRPLGPRPKRPPTEPPPAKDKP